MDEGVLYTFWTWGLSGLLGAALGSFLNVVVYRLPLGLSLVTPGSRCPGCLTPLGWQENIPILGWIWLRGKCRHCGIPISSRYPLVELGTALVFIGLTWRFGPFPFDAWLFACLLIALALIDLDTLELPHSLTFPGIYLGLGLKTIFAPTPWLGLLEGLLGYGVAVFLLDSVGWLGKLYLGIKAGYSWRTLIGWQPLAALGVLALGFGLGGTLLQAPWTGGIAFYGGVLLLWDSYTIGQSWLSPPPEAIEEEEDALVALGGGDVILGGLLGAWLGWAGLLVALAIGFSLGALYGLSARFLGRLSEGERFPFGPFLALGGGISLVAGSWLVDRYLQILGIT